MRILLVEDSRTTAAVVRTFLSWISARAVVDVAPTRREALARLESSRYDLVLLDLILPPEAPARPLGPDGSEGFAVLEEARRSAPSTPVVLVTALPRTHPTVSAALRAGAVGHLRKPVRLETLRATVGRLVPVAEAGAHGRVRPKET